MIGLKFEILTIIYDSDKHRIRRGELVNHYLSRKLLNKYQQAESDLAKINYIEFLDGKEYIALSPKIIPDYEAERYRRDQEAKQQSAKKREAWFLRITTIISTAIALVELFILLFK